MPPSLSAGDWAGTDPGLTTTSGEVGAGVGAGRRCTGVGAGAATGEKDETTVASSDPALLERPLGARWLEKVWASANAAPRRAGQPPEARGPIHEGDYATLKRHPQFRESV